MDTKLMEGNGAVGLKKVKKYGLRMLLKVWRFVIVWSWFILKVYMIVIRESDMVDPIGKRKYLLRFPHLSQ